jgi:hypothetical protein
MSRLRVYHGLIISLTLLLSFRGIAMAATQTADTAGLGTFYGTAGIIERLFQPHRACEFAKTDAMNQALEACKEKGYEGVDCATRITMDDSRGVTHACIVEASDCYCF